MDENSVYQDIYHKMFNAATDAERQLRQVMEQLQKAQQECEEMYIEAGEACQDS